MPLVLALAGGITHSPQRSLPWRSGLKADLTRPSPGITTFDLVLEVKSQMPGFLVIQVAQQLFD
ncbi:hypothetical protein DXM27_16600 [Rhizobium rhizogenes]|uniref:Uncharacterized protein n=1 Tax=Rhizobium rhizogenes TaxID=359 RepID=A0AA88EYJ2_RHIRH|nr:hypothetical protein DXM27_16600 [Rhizobium rhizogenes]